MTQPSGPDYGNMAGRMAGLDRATDKQRQVLIAYLRHGSYKDAARSLGINHNTARTRIAHMLKVTGAKTVTEAAYMLGREQSRRL